MILIHYYHKNILYSFNPYIIRVFLYITFKIADQRFLATFKYHNLCIINQKHMF